MNIDSRRFLSPRLMPNAGYSDDPGPIPFLSKLIIPGDYPKVARDVTIAGRRFEIWSPNSRRLPFYPGIKAPGVDLEDLAKGKRRYDGHLGPLDPTYHPQHYQPRRPYLPFIRRHSHLNPSSLFPEFVSLFDNSEAWSPLAGSVTGEGRITESYVKRLKKRNTSLLQDAKLLRDGLRESYSERDRLLWQNHPLYPSNMHIEALLDIVSFEEALDTVTEMQRGIKMREAWINYVRLKNLAPWDPADLAYAFAVEGNEQYMGIWMSDEAYEDALLYMTRSGVACFFLHEYTAQEATFHHRTHAYYPDAAMQNYVLVSDEDGPWRYAVRRSKLRALALEEGESVGRVKRLPHSFPAPGSLSLSNRQGYRLPSLRDERPLPAAKELAELASRPRTPVKFWHDMDGLEADAPRVASLPVVRVPRNERKPSGEAEASEPVIAPLVSNRKGKGKRRESTSPLPDYESKSEAEPAVASAIATTVARELEASVHAAQGASMSRVDVVSEAQSPNFSAAVSDRAKELYAAYTRVISEFWRIDSLPRDVTTPKELLKLLQETSKEIPFAIPQMLRTWKERRDVYWVRFGDRDQALRVRGYLSRASVSGADGCDGPLVTESTYLLAMEEVREPEERPASPTGYWNLPIDLDPRFREHSESLTKAEPQTQSAQYVEAVQPNYQRKLITPDHTGASQRSPPSPSATRSRKKTRINSPPRQFVASRSTRAIQVTTASAPAQKHKSLSERITSDAPSHQEPNEQTRQKGSESRYSHNRPRYHRR
ncbi:hypothetical protein PC9H_010893 [Pleurotus ostreatus]|uniref:Uncharacterized protein n=2 Tax=Pleurotus TaxID=5320 RepID=A0A8H6ZNM9_PLEOS|nr:uncharacterized protein PC9H_010893 [Pleurotus ostreatus]KAF7422736.1 hypothetical protein PC9H_010893 [Pleurotus ostreatus]KAG9227417.1 hypothetical protein CCMSSC00406_0004044 [Pleurotus cornucopiae]